MRRLPPGGIKLLAATTNRGKIREIVAALEGLPVEVSTLDDLRPLPVAPEETGTTFMENARMKGEFYSRLTPRLTLAEDSGLEVDRLGGAPGVLSARFAGPGADDARNIAKVLELLRDVPEGERSGRFVCCAALCRAGVVLAEMTGRVEGRIALEPRGRGGFGYDPIFFFPALGRTFAELSPAEKTEVSHRGRALRQVREFLLHPGREERQE
jgi:XTP/dITP diphosphohydrolase